MNKRLFLVAGPQSFGNRLLVEMLTTAGIAGHPNHAQPWDRSDLSLSLEQAPPLITLHRSAPHAGDWDAINRAIGDAKRAGYTVNVLTPVRAQDAAEASLVRRQLAPDLEAARLQIEKAWHTIFAATCAHCVGTLLIPIGELNTPQFLAWLAKTLELPRCPAPVLRDEDTKHRQHMPEAMAFSFDWTTCHAKDWERWLIDYRNRGFLKVLTVGAAEGRTECWMLANIAFQPSDELHTVEPGYVPEWHARLKRNHAAHPQRARWTLWELPAAQGLPALIKRQYQYDIIYLDANHEEHAVYADLLNCWQLLKQGGTLIVDDYAYRDARIGEGPGNAVRWALAELHEELTIEVVHGQSKGQAMLRKNRQRAWE